MSQVMKSNLAQTRPTQGRVETSLQEIGVTHRLARSIGEDEIVISLRTSELPFLEFKDQKVRQIDAALRVRGFRIGEGAFFPSATDVELLRVPVDIAPGQAENFTLSHPGEHRDLDQEAPRLIGCFNQLSNLVWC